MTDRYSIVLADDHVILREGLKRIISERADLNVVGEAGDGLELLKVLHKVTPHLIILDMSMPNLRGTEVIPEIKRVQPDAKILILTMYTGEAYLFQALSAGADGYLLKGDAEKELFTAIDRIRKGQVYISPALAQHSLGDWVKKGIEEGDLRLAEQLSLREREVLKLIAENKSNKEIGDLLCISVRTVEHHRANIMAKLKIKGTAALVQYAIRHQYI
jgi:DNA-binding NarL/FixJ family response regulator